MRPVPQQEDRTLRLGDGRVLGYSSWGSPQAPCVFYFHGWPGSRREGSALQEIAHGRGVRVVAADRPGYGLSSFQGGRTISDWPSDVRQLADHLAAPKFSLVGVSGGAPYALACAWAMPQRVQSVAIVCGMGPVETGDARRMTRLNRSLCLLARRLPGLTRWLFDPLARLFGRNPHWIVSSWMTARLPAADQETLRDPLVRATLTETMREAFRQGPAGARHDGLLYLRPWGFPLEEIRIPIQLWHGELDRNVPASFGRELANRLPRCHARFFSGEGHFSLPFRQAGEILENLLEAATSQSLGLPDSSQIVKSRPS